MSHRMLVGLSWMMSCLFVQPVVGQIDSSFMTPHYQKRLAEFVLEPIVGSPILFLGNSLTEGFDLASYFPHRQILNRGIVGDNTFGFFHRLQEITNRQPQRIFILGGVNDIASNIPLEMYLRNYQKLVSEIQHACPDTKIYIQSLLPANFDKMKFKRMAGKEGKIEEFNKGLETMARRMSIDYIPLYPSFLNQDKTQLDPSFTNDGLHLLPPAYDLLAQLLKPYLQ